MIHESLLVLAGHPSSLLPETGSLPDLPFLHPGELASLARIQSIACLYKRVRSYCTSSLSAATTPSGSRPTRAHSCLCAALLEQLESYSSLIRSLEQRILSRDSDLVGPTSKVPLSSVAAAVGNWETTLSGLCRLVDNLEERRDKSWTATDLINLLHRNGQTGLPELGRILADSQARVELVWIKDFTAFVVHATLPPGQESLVRVSEDNRYVFPPENLPSLPNLEPPQAVLGTLQQICLALSILHRAGETNRLGLPRGLKSSLQDSLAGSTGPGERVFARRLDDIRSESHVFPCDAIYITPITNLQVTKRHSRHISSKLTSLPRISSRPSPFSPPSSSSDPVPLHPIWSKSFSDSERDAFSPREVELDCPSSNSASSSYARAWGPSLKRGKVLPSWTASDSSCFQRARLALRLNGSRPFCSDLALRSIMCLRRPWSSSLLPRHCRRTVSSGAY
jgi:hypothetical protein